MCTISVELTYTQKVTRRQTEVRGDFFEQHTCKASLKELGGQHCNVNVHNVHVCDNSKRECESELKIFSKRKTHTKTYYEEKPRTENEKKTEYASPVSAADPASSTEPPAHSSDVVTGTEKSLPLSHTHIQCAVVAKRYKFEINFRQLNRK